jgi:SAM-dependent methyltransferase
MHWQRTSRSRRYARQEGPAGILVPLSRRVGPIGFVVGVDLDSRHLMAARALVHDANLTNVEILKRHIYDTRLPREAFDFVHARLASGSPARHEELLDEVLAVTRPGGVVAIQCVAWLAGPAPSKHRGLGTQVSAVAEEIGGT